MKFYTVKAVVISIHAPLAGCDVPAGYALSAPSISIHAPLAGCDSIDVSLVAPYAISIHAPLAGCDQALLDLFHFGRISIHAPLAGRGPPGITWRMPISELHRRTPCGVRQTLKPAFPKIVIFQSTHPLRGATQRVQHPGAADHQHFNPRTPCGVRHVASGCRLSMLRISIHAPLAGCDERFLDLTLCDGISIHAPLAGCDV